MKLEPEQESMRSGENGRIMAKAMETVVRYGEAFGAKRLVPIKSAHLAGTFGIGPFRAYLQILGQIASEGLKVRVPTTVNPRPGYNLNFINRRIAFPKQEPLEELLAAIGTTPNYSCVCYEKANVPSFGDRLAWAESSAVQFANSVLGARTNRNSILMDVCCAITGFTPEFGYLLDAHRRGQMLVKLDIKKMDAPALGYLLGERVVDKVPVLEHYPFSRIELKNMGGSMAASGGVALFHVEGLTPEAPGMNSVFDGPPETTITVTQEDLDSMRLHRPGKADMVVFGCPQMTCAEALGLAEKFAGKKARVPTWFCMVPHELALFREHVLYGKTLDAGVMVLEYCPLGALSLRLGKKHILTPSGKLLYYLKGADYGTEDDCLRACGVMQ
ncbi:MAG TPA: aconitase X catalytic domain-containing protein [Desulfomonilia bacterium]|nr:aconitase X catalytic domain-containing protein [Desulfomonilia bacterium]